MTIAVDPIVQSERGKYEALWSDREHRTYSSGEAQFDRIHDHLRSVEAHRVLEVGCGSGRLAAKLAGIGYELTALDIASNCLDADAAGFTFMRACLWDAKLPKVDCVISSDVLEHLPCWTIEPVIASMCAAAPHGWHKIACGPERNNHGGERLHLTVNPPAWWIERFEALVSVEEIHNDLNVFVWW